MLCSSSRPLLAAQHSCLHRPSLPAQALQRHQQERWLPTPAHARSRHAASAALSATSWPACPPPQYSVGIKANRQQTYGTGQAPSASPYGWLALAAAGGALVALLFGGRLRWNGGRRGTGGRWVRDRSLGGRMVFIPDAESGAQPKPQRSLYDELGGGDDGAAVVATSGGGEAGPWATSFAPPQQQGGREPELPSWWKTPNFLVYTPFSRKDELQRQARVVLRQLEDAKLLQARGPGGG